MIEVYFDSNSLRNRVIGFYAYNEDTNKEYYISSPIKYVLPTNPNNRIEFDNCGKNMSLMIQQLINQIHNDKMENIGL